MAEETKNNQQEAQPIPKEVEQSYKKGLEALERRNYDYAIYSFQSGLNLFPDYPDCRHNLRVAERRKYEENPPSAIAKIMLKGKLSVPLVTAGVQESTGKNMAAVNTYEKILAEDPYNSFALNKLAGIFMKEGMNESAIKTYEELVEVIKTDAEAFRNLGRLYAHKGEYNKAQACYQSILTINPEDDDAQTNLKNLDALKTIHRGKWEEQKTYRDALKDEKAALKLEKEDKIVRTEADVDFFIKENEEKLRANTEDITVLRTLGDLYFRKNDFRAALQRYENALKSDPGNLALQRKIADVKIKELEVEAAALEETITLNPGNQTAKQELEKLQANLQEVKLDELKNRVAQYPSDLSLHFEYGLSLKKANHIDKAIGEFQLAVNDPTRRNQALNLLGLCFKEKKMYDLAVAQFQKALVKIKGMDEEVKEIVYNLGDTFEAMGDFHKAVAEYKKIYEVDINYRDIAHKMEKAYKSKA